MANIEGNCPKCNNPLSIPETLKTFSCMYCGAVLTQEELLSKESGRQEHSLEPELVKLYENKDPKVEDLIDEILEDDKYNAKANEIYARLHFNEILLEHQDAMKYFKRNEYAGYFEKYRMKCRPVLETVGRYADGAADRGEAFMRELAAGLVRGIAENVASDSSTRTKNGRALKESQLRMILAIFTIPMVQEQKLSCSDRLADLLVEEWCRMHPKEKITKGNFRDMESGFKKGKLCFITTAVCDSFGKPDDCYELQSFRAFRDEIMGNSETGRALIHEYYDIAPGIVTCIDMQEDRKEIYRLIWERWLSHCLSDIEENRMESCRLRYEEMVRTLEKKYLAS